MLILNPKFSLGRIVITSGAGMRLSKGDVTVALGRHLSGDWGELDEFDWKANDDALEYGARLLSAYRTASGARFWIITEHDRSVTTILLPEEY